LGAEARCEPAAEAVEDDADGDAEWPLGMAMNATTAATRAAPAIRAIVRGLGRRRSCLVCAGLEWPGGGWLGEAWTAGGPQDGAIPVTVGWFEAAARLPRPATGGR